RRHATQTGANKTPPAAEDADSKPSPAPEPEPERRTNAGAAGTPRSDGRILAAPRARRVAREQGLDLEGLVQG
ncbi:pyruvate dehydrogenase, partial [Tritonibacter sp. SIMBA_163]